MSRMPLGILRHFVFALGLLSTLAHASYDEALLAITQQNYARALPLLEAAAEKNDPRAWNALGFLYSRGLGVARDEKRALDWFEKAANAGNLRAMNGLVALYADGSRDIPKNIPLARDWAWKASLANDPDAQFNYARLAILNELSTLGADGRVSRDKYLALAKRPMTERGLDGKAYTMLARAAEQGHLAAISVSLGLLSSWPGPNRAQRSQELLAKLPLTQLPPPTANMAEEIRAANAYLKSLGRTYVTGSVFRDALMTAVPMAFLKANIEFSACDVKNVRVVKASITRELSQPVYLPVSAALLKDVVLVQGNWQETWGIDLCGTLVDVPIEFQVDGGGGAHFQVNKG